MTYPSVPSLGAGQALFLDLDGTLIELRNNPAAVRADIALLQAVDSCFHHLGGALAVVSGRPIVGLDISLAPHRFPAAGLHGLERRDATGIMHGPRTPTELFMRAREDVHARFAGDPDIRIEDKDLALAIHFRATPARGSQVREVARQVVANIGPTYRMLEGSGVVELLPREASKGAAVRAFMKEAPFSGRLPVFVGDDITDLEGFQAARDLGGYGIAVGHRVTAEYRLKDVVDVRRWLGAMEVINEH